MKDFAKVLDFGLAKVTEREMRPGSIILTQEGMVFGTPEFMSPEQAQGKTLTPGSDIYSLAVILYEVLTGKLPFDAKNPMEYIQLHVTTKPKPINERVPGRTFPPLLWTVLSKALEKKSEDRYAVGRGVRACAASRAGRRDRGAAVPGRRAPSGAAVARQRPHAARAGRDCASGDRQRSRRPRARARCRARRPHRRGRRSVCSSASRSRSSWSAPCSRRSCSKS